MSRPLPPLSRRATRIRLLAWSYEDALTTGTTAGGDGDSAVSRLLLHDELWCQGSYREMSSALDLLTRRERRTFIAEHVAEQKLFKSGEWQTIVKVGLLMPPNIYVPEAVSEAAGYLPTDAKIYRMPQREAFRRLARLAT